MRAGIRRILVTGGAGFIGSAFVRYAVKKRLRISVYDKLTYAADVKRLAECRKKISFYKADICSRVRLEQVFRKEQPQAVVHFAAETHVDRSIRDPAVFMETNCLGTQALLDTAKKFGVARFVYISTDEVYGEIEKGTFNEESPLSPNSPYAASKAAADLLLSSYMRTYGFPAIIIRPCNNYGPWQYPEKLVPLAILKLFRGEKVPVYGHGTNVREWLYGEDCAEGIWQALQKGDIGQVYNLGSGQESKNIDTVKLILKSLNKDLRMFEFVKDRPGHDLRYSLDSGKLYKVCGWKPKIRLAQGIGHTIDWSLLHWDWLFSKWADIARLYAFKK